MKKQTQKTKSTNASKSKLKNFKANTLKKEQTTHVQGGQIQADLMDILGVMDFL